MRRRDFLRVSAGTTFLSLGSGAWAATGEGGPKRLIVIFLRGAVDGLNVVVPYGERAYYDARPTIAIARAGTDGGALPLDDVQLAPGPRQLITAVERQEARFRPCRGLA